ncbi:MAG: putative DNA-binding domain-containing protein [Rudaea sp.]
MSALPDVDRTRRLQYQFTAHLRDPKKNPAPPGIEDRRMEIYRDLVFSNVEMFLSANFPVIRNLYSEADWMVMTRDFLREHQCHTPLFPEFGREFLRYIEYRREQQRGDPDFLLELAHYEWAELALSLDENEISDTPHDASGDPLTGVPVMSPLACVLAYRYPVHLIGPDYRPDDAPADPTVLLLVRGRDDEVRFNEINALTAMLIERLQQNEDRTGEQCLDDLLTAQGLDDRSLRTAGAEIFRDLKTYGAILGTVLD